MIYQCIVAGVLGIVINVFFLTIIWKKYELRRKDYICFIMNQMLIDCVYSLSLATLQPMGMWSAVGIHNTIQCTVAAFAEVSLSIMTIVSEPVLACNRYLAICHSGMHKKTYTHSVVIFMCVFVWLICIISVIPHIYYESLGRVPGMICSVRFAIDTLLVTVLSSYIIVLISIGLVAIFNVKMFLFLRHYQKQTTMSGTQRSKIQKDSEMLLFIAVAAALPLLMQMPIVLATVVRMLSPEIINDWVLFSLTSIFVLCPVVNPIVTVFMVRPLKTEFKAVFFRCFKPKTSAVVSTISVRPAKEARLQTTV